MIFKGKVDIILFCHWCSSFKPFYSLFKIGHNPWIKLSAGSRSGSCYIHSNFHYICSKIQSCVKPVFQIVLDACINISKVHGHIIFKVEVFLFCCCSNLFYKRGVKVFQDTVINMKTVKSQLNTKIKKFKGCELSFPW